MRSDIPTPQPLPHFTLPERRWGVFFSRDESSGPERQPPHSPRILIVEDDFLVSIQTESALIEAGLDVTGIATSADEAVELATLQRPSLVVMDIRLAGERDGIDAALQLFREHGIRCIFATAHSDGETRKRGNAAAPLGWLPKPYTMTSLLDMVRSALRRPGEGE
jgi:two-component system, response regulator PdtaR